MANHPPWRDIPGKNAMRRYLLGDENARSTGTVVGSAVQAVERYQNIRKDDASLFGQRIMLLKEISGHLLAARPRLKGDQEHNAGVLAEVAANRAMYLTKVQSFIQRDMSGVNDPHGFLTVLERQRVTVPRPPPRPQNGGWVRAQVGGGQIGLSGGVGFEKLDPFHRENELSFKSRTGSRDAMWSASNVHVGGTAEHAVPYARKVLDHGYNQPFLAYLETRACCLWEQQNSSGQYTSVGYAEPGQQLDGTSLVSMSKGRLHETTSDGRLVMFDTTGVVGSRKGEKHKTKAYVWLKTGDFVVAIHQPGEMHHSSLNGGELVRCAGMIGGTSGRVHYVDSNSGHYRAGLVQLHNLIKFLDDQQLLTGDAQTFAGGQDMFISDYLLEPVRHYGEKVGITIGSHRR